ncbi:cytochrome P450 family protein [Streptomyces sp. Je 1-369]|uniref:cytochrome P450 family protein n=1 Tax=Streptomyces sp. Je 1-369 TaxID=2966192 RepID=UPI002285E08C|nr:cytochrome P450 [Streptomyces sp. Je 1-369]WAL98747.1 cytochrome P450 [Streptomyces sp. Je 1-369]
MADSIDLDTYGARFREDPHSVYAELRSLGPVHRVRLPPPEDMDDTYLVVGYEECRTALREPRFAKSAAAGNFAFHEEDLIGTHLLIADPPQHTRLRALVTREFTMRRVEALRPRIQRITDDLLDEMLVHGESATTRRADLFEALAFHLPITVICELLGVPDIDRAAFRRMSTGVVASPNQEEERAAFVELAGYLTDLVEDKRRSGQGEDLLSALIRTTDDESGDRLSASELRAMAFLLLIAGHETTVNLIANGVHALFTHPDQLAALRADMSLLDGAIEEALRYEGPVECATYRFATEPTELGGIVIPTGAVVRIALAAADRDPARFSDPDRFDIRRAPQGHMAFGHGLHHCLGAPLARVEAKIALGSLLERCPGLASDGPPGEWLPGTLIRGMRRLPVRW